MYGSVGVWLSGVVSLVAEEEVNANTIGLSSPAHWSFCRGIWTAYTVRLVISATRTLRALPSER
jgi:hypothetical protein